MMPTPMLAGRAASPAAAMLPTTDSSTVRLSVHNTVTAPHAAQTAAPVISHFICSWRSPDDRRQART